MSNSKSRRIERKAGGWRVYAANDTTGAQQGEIPSHLIAALKQCVKRGSLSPKMLTDEDRLEKFLARLVKRPEIGVEFGLASLEIEELVALWNSLAEKVVKSATQRLLPQQLSLRHPPAFEDELEKRIWERKIKSAKYLDH